MAETLLAILLVTHSAKGSGLVYRWPPSPVFSPRLSRARPTDTSCASDLDNPWRASRPSDLLPSVITTDPPHARDNEMEYQWKRAHAPRERSTSYSHPASHPASGRNSPSKDGSYKDSPVRDEYDHLFGYSSEFLAGLLCPQRSLCHQKFELLVDDLAFLGHPVCAEADGGWRFKPEKIKPSARGRESRNRQNEDAGSPSPDMPPEKPLTAQGSWLQTFHFVMVLDLPDPSSSASGNVSKYFDIVYEQIAFTVTAVLFQEQVLSNFVEAECDILGSLKDSYMSKGAF